MKIRRYFMEDWLNESFARPYNLSASGSQDLTVRELLDLCGEDAEGMYSLSLGDNDTMGSEGLREEIRACYDNVSPNEVMVTNGSSEALFCFFNEFLQAGDEVIIPFPAFQCLYQVPVAIGCAMKYLPVLEADGWRLDIDRLEELVTPKTKLIIVNNPHNPVGWVLSDDDIRRIAHIAAANGCALLFDEHYRYLPLDEGTDLLPSGYCLCKDICPNTFASGSMIKCFGIVGLRIGWLLGEPRFLSRCRDYKDYITHTTPSITDHLGRLALKNKEVLIRRKKQDILPNVTLLGEFMGRHSDLFHYLPPEGGVVCFPRLKFMSDSSRFCRDLVESTGVSLLPGMGFEIEEHFRVNVGVDREIFSIAIRLLEDWLGDYPRSV